MKKMILFGLLLFTYATSSCYEIFIFGTKISRFYIEESNIKKINVDGRIAYAVWGKEIPRKNKTIEWRKKEIEDRKKYKLSIKGFDKLDHVITYTYVDCDKGEIKPISTYYYNTDGEVIDESQMADFTEWRVPIPGTMGDNFLKETEANVNGNLINFCCDDLTN